MADGPHNWRDIRCADVDWGVAWVRTGSEAKIRYAIMRMCRPESRHFAAGEWHHLTLGELADRGEREWRSVGGIGHKAVDLIKATIDRAAEGKPVTKSAPQPDAYVPRCEREGEGDADAD